MIKILQSSYAIYMVESERGSQAMSCFKVQCRHLIFALDAWAAPA